MKLRIVSHLIELMMWSVLLISAYAQRDAWRVNNWPAFVLCAYVQLAFVLMLRPHIRSSES